MLRPLRSVTRIAGMKRLVVALLKSLPLLLDVVALFAFLMFIYGLVAVQIFGGALRQRCADVSLPGRYLGDYSPGDILPLKKLHFTAEMDDTYPHCTGPSYQDAEYYLAKDGATVLFRGGALGTGRVCPIGQVCYNKGE